MSDSGSVGVVPVGDSQPFSNIRPVLRVADVRRAAEFYRDKLGFEIDTDEGDLVILSRGQVGIQFGPARGAPPSLPSELFLSVGDVDRLYGELVAKGLKTHGAPADRYYGLRDFTAEDCHGMLLSFNQPAACRPDISN